MATAVSSHDVSRANTVMSSEVETSLASKFPGTSEQSQRFLDSARNDKEGKAALLFLYRFRFRGVLLRVNHDALERVDCAPHLGILGLDDILFVLGFDISSVAQRKEGALLFFSHGNTNIGNHAIALIDLLTRCVV